MHRGGIWRSLAGRPGLLPPRSRMALTVDTRIATEYGAVRAVGQGDFQFQNFGNTNPATPVGSATGIGNALFSTAGGGSGRRWKPGRKLHLQSGFQLSQLGAVTGCEVERGEARSRVSFPSHVAVSARLPSAQGNTPSRRDRMSPVTRRCVAPRPGHARCRYSSFSNLAAGLAFCSLHKATM